MPINIIRKYTHTGEYKPLFIRRVEILYRELLIMYRLSMRHIRSELQQDHKFYGLHMWQLLFEIQ
jgi:hypothetical protein